MTTHCADILAKMAACLSFFSLCHACSAISSCTYKNKGSCNSQTGTRIPLSSLQKTTPTGMSGVYILSRWYWHLIARLIPDYRLCMNNLVSIWWLSCQDSDKVPPECHQISTKLQGHSYSYWLFSSLHALWLVHFDIRRDKLAQFWNAEFLNNLAEYHPNSKFPLNSKEA